MCRCGCGTGRREGLASYALHDRAPRTRTATLLATATAAGSLALAALAPPAAAVERAPVLCELSLLVHCPPTPQPPTRDPRGVGPGAPNPLASLNFFVARSGTPQREQFDRYLALGDRGRAALAGMIALRPQFKWFGRWSESARGGAAGAIRRHLDRAAEEQPGSVPQVVTMRHQGRECGFGYAGGGAAEDRRTRQWYRDFARGVGSSRVVIGFEPDSLGTIDCLAPSARGPRLNLLRYGVDVLSALPNATVYLEAGASDWEPAARTARQLRYIGIRKVRGFMLNVTHYDWTANNIRHGLAVSRRVGRKPFVISTSFNGRGPVHYRRWVDRARHRWRTVNVWCHPLRRGLGPAPTTDTHHPRVDAYLYIGRPGLSGGSCNGGPLPVGSWFPERAQMLGRYATNWIRPPKGTRNGHPGHVSVRALAGDQYRR